MIKRSVDSNAFTENLRVDKLLNKADLDLVRFAHVVRGWGVDNTAGSFFFEAIAESLSLIVLKGDTFTRSLTHVHAPKPETIELRNIYRAAFEQKDLTTIQPTVSFELFIGGDVFSPRVAFGESAKSLQEHLRVLYGDCSKVAIPAFEVIKYLTYRGWHVFGYAYQEDGCTVNLTNSVVTGVVRINYEPMRLDRAAIRKYQQTRKH